MASTPEPQPRSSTGGSAAGARAGRSPKAGLGGRVLARAEGEPGIDLDRDRAGRQRRRGRASRARRSGRPDRRQAQLAACDPIRAGEPRRRGCRRWRRHAAQNRRSLAASGAPVRTLAKQQIDLPADRLGRRLVLELESGDAQRLVLDSLRAGPASPARSVKARAPEFGAISRAAIRAITIRLDEAVDHLLPARLSRRRCRACRRPPPRSGRSRTCRGRSGRRP